MVARRNYSFRIWCGAAAIAAVATAAAAQQADPSGPAASSPNSTSALRLPQNPQLFGAAIPTVVKATAIINGDVITQTDVNQRLALLAMANGGQIAAEEVDRLRQQILRNLIDETLQIQAAKAEEIEVRTSDVDRAVARVASNVQRNPEQLAEYLEANGSSIRGWTRTAA